MVSQVQRNTGHWSAVNQGSRPAKWHDRQQKTLKYGCRHMFAIRISSQLAYQGLSTQSSPMSGPTDTQHIIVLAELDG